MDKVIELIDVVKIFKVKKKSNENFIKRFLKKSMYKTVIAVDGVSLNINKGEFVGLVGNNGAGKSTLIKMITGILYNTSGTVKVFGNDPYKNRLKNNKKISVVFGQRTQLRWDLSPMDSFRLLKVIYEIEDDIYTENLNRFIQLFEMESFINQPVRTLSLGQKMKCEITAAFLHNPEIVLLDEPTIGLDIFSKDAITSFLKEIKKSKKITVLLTTHDMNEISEICDRSIFIDKGKVIIDEIIDKLMSIHVDTRDVIITTENMTPMKISKEYEAQIDYSKHKISLKNANKNIISELISEIMKKNTITDIAIKEKSFTELVKKIYGKGENKDEKN